MKLEKYKEKAPNKIGIIIFTIICILLITGVFLYTSFASFETKEEFNIINGKVENPGDLYFVFYVDNVISKTMPQKGEGYVIDTTKTTCTNGASVELNVADWSIKVLNMTTTNTKCTLYFQKNASGYLESLYNNGNSSLAYDNTEEKNLRYVGAIPDNYVYFNCDDISNPTNSSCQKWRIIGSFNNVDDGTGQKETRLKIIYSDFPGNGYFWDNTGTNGKNNWNLSSAKSFFNDGTYWNRTSGSCDDYNNSTTVCDLSEIGLKASAKNFFKEALWYLGGSDTAELTPLEFYENERSKNVFTNNPTEWTGDIGLISVSDFGFAMSGDENDSRDFCLQQTLEYSTNNCYLTSWLRYAWTMNANSDNDEEAFYCNDYGCSSYYVGYIDSNGTNGAFILPTLYLKSEVKIISGNGSFKDPFVIQL